MEKRHFCVETEYERGWGSKPWAVAEYATEELARAAVKACNDQNTASSAPDWYVSAQYSNDLNHLYSKDYVDKRKK